MKHRLFCCYSVHKVSVPCPSGISAFLSTAADPWFKYYSFHAYANISSFPWFFFFVIIFLWPFVVTGGPKPGKRRVASGRLTINIKLLSRLQHLFVALSYVWNTLICVSGASAVCGGCSSVMWRTDSLEGRWSASYPKQRKRKCV